MAVEDDLTELVEQQEDANALLLSSAAIALSAPLRAFQAWYDYRAVTGLVGLLGRLLGGYEATAARGADSFMAQAISIATGRRFQPAGVRRTALGRPGVDDLSVLGRIANAYRFQQSQVDRTLMQSVNLGILLSPPADPRDAALDRLDRIVQTNLQVTQRSQHQTTMAAAGERITGYRRIIHPELATEGTCGLCIAASDRVYKVKTLLPIHPGCHCTVLPITRANDPGGINATDLGRIYKDAGDTAAESLRSTRYRIDEHGEIGPVIRPEGEPIRTERQAERARKTPEEREFTRERKREAMVTALDSFRTRRQNDPGRFGDARWDDVESALANRITDLDEAA